MAHKLRSAARALLFLSAPAVLAGQTAYQPANLDPAREVAAPKLESRLHQPLPEQYIWSSDLGSDRNRDLYFRYTFTVEKAPAEATLYVAGPDRQRVYLDGRLVGNAERDPHSRIRPLVLAANVGRGLRAGAHTLAIEAAGGDRLAVKIVPRGAGLMAPALAASGPGWKWNDRAAAGWERPGFNDWAWHPAAALDSIENQIDFFQWNSDAGMYRWPGYDGISPFLARMPLAADNVSFAFEGLGKLANVKALTLAVTDEAARSREPLTPAQLKAEFAKLETPPKPLTAPGSTEFAVTLAPRSAAAEERPYVLLDFGRETDGRLEVVSDSTTAAEVEVQYGESLEEAVNEPYLGADPILVPPHATAYGPKSAFRYALVRFTGGGPGPLRFKAIRVDAIYYPVKYLGSFESSDALLNRIWQVGAYTSHLCMQDDIWDAPKRDRGRWMGDLDVSGRVIDTVFADHFLMQDTLDRLVGEAGTPVHGDVNTIPGYSAFWVMGQADYYRHLGDKTYLRAIHTPLVQLLDYMTSEMDGRGLFVNGQHHWPFVDWSPDLDGDTPEARRATTLEFYKAFAEGAWLLREEGDTASADKFEAQAEKIKQAALRDLLDSPANTFGSRWQTNAMAIFSGVADAAETEAIWQKVLSHPSQFVITPYYNFYAITAMAESGHRREALDWIRKYWGGMIEEGATSYWEAYDPGWPKHNFHESLQADQGKGYFVSLSHGWSSGPTAWLTEQVLGIQPLAAGFSKAAIRPDLAGLEWARGAEPTPHGAIKVDYRAGANAGSGLEATVELPDGVQAELSLPVTAGTTSAEVNGAPMSGTVSEDGTRLVVELTHAGSYRVVTH